MKIYYIKIMNEICEEEHYVVATNEFDARTKIIEEYEKCKILKMKLLCEKVII